MSAYQGSMCGSGAFGYGLTHLKEALLVLPIAGFFLISRCTGRAHETSEVTERFEFRSNPSSERKKTSISSHSFH